MGDDQRDRLPELAADLVRRRVAAIVANTAAAPEPPRPQLRRSRLSLSSGSDPVDTGLVTSLSRPGGNITGLVFTVTEITAKRLALLHELAPKAAIIAVLLDPTSLERPPSCKAWKRRVAQSRRKS